MQKDLQKNVAEFIFDLMPLASTQGHRQLLGLGLQESDQRDVRLLSVPGTALGRTQAGHQRDQTVKRRGGQSAQLQSRG